MSQCVRGSGMVQINVEVKSQPGMLYSLEPRLAEGFTPLETKTEVL